MSHKQSSGLYVIISDIECDFEMNFYYTPMSIYFIRYLSIKVCQDVKKSMKLYNLL